MEASWRGCSLRQDGETLTLQEVGAAPVVIPLHALMGFTVIPTGPVSPGRASAIEPDGRLVVAWREGGRTRSAQLDVPREALQVQLFLMRLAQLVPGADLREVPPKDALKRLGEAAPHSRRAWVVAAVGLAVLAAAVVLAVVGAQ